MATDNSNSFPPFEHFADDRSHLRTLRTGVTPVLSNRVLTNFTDHSVQHSDHLTQVVDQLITPLQQSGSPLSNDELTILYASCYLHDIGMQFEAAGETTVIRSLNLPKAWADLPEHERRKLLRENHHLISAEMVMKSVNTANPLIGFNLTNSYKPRLIAGLCEAQNLSVDSERYRELTSDVAGIRMRLLSGLLRLADILEESRRRASIEQARTLQLDLTSQTHWWRHYFTENVTFDQSNRLVTIWFDFPAEFRDEYASVVPNLQIPWIENEFRYHADVFNQNGFGWSLTYTVSQTPYTDALPMPDSVLGEMWKQTSRSREEEIRRTKHRSLDLFRRSIPFFDRRISELEVKKDTLPGDEYLTLAVSVSRDLWEVGGRRSAVELLSAAYSDEACAKLEPSIRVKIAIEFARMVFQTDDPRRAANILTRVKGVAEELSNEDEEKFRFWQEYSEILFFLCGYNEAVSAFGRAMELAPYDFQREALATRLAEMHLLVGEVEALANVK
jgi:hypothetical protein